MTTTRRQLFVGCTTIPSRAQFLPRVIDQIEKQTIRPDAFCIGVPSYSTREKVEYDIAWIEKLAEERSKTAGFGIVIEAVKVRSE